MEPRAHHVLIGLFTVIAVTAALLFALWLNKSTADEQRYYLVVFNEAVRGLSKGSEVQYNGIKIGEVVNLELDPQDPRRVLARIRVNGKTPIKQDTKAWLALTSITGNSVIQFSGGTPDSPNLVSADGKEPVIVATPSPFAKLLEESGDNLAEITELIQRAAEILSPENVRHFSKILANLDRTSGALAGQDENFRELIQELTASSRQANSVLQQASKLVGDAQSLVDDEGSRALGSAGRAMASLENSANALDQLLRDNRAGLAGGVRGLNELAPALQELRETLISVRRIASRLEDNPASYLTGREKIEEVEP
jgi:phospholipid/cholesterol/gamma-HCH transport system substrate-binding protein